MFALVDAGLIGERVARRRRERGWDQSELARRSGVSGSYISRLEGGAYARPSVERLGALATALGCRVVDLTDPPPEDDAGALAEQLYALGFRRDEAPLVEKLVTMLLRRPRQREQLLTMFAQMVEMTPE